MKQKNIRMSDEGWKILAALKAMTGESDTESIENTLAMQAIAYGVETKRCRELLVANIIGRAAATVIHKPHPGAAAPRPTKRTKATAK